MRSTVALFTYLAAAMAKVHQINADNFDQFIADNPNVLMKFYAPWCGHCKKLAPEFEAASDVTGDSVKFAEIDLSEDSNKSIGQRFGVRGYPTIKYFERGDPKEYDAGRTRDAFIKYVEKISRQSLMVMANRQEVQKLQETTLAGEAFMVYEGATKPTSTEFQIYKAFCDENKTLIQCVAYGGPPGEQPVLEIMRPDSTSTRHPIDYETTHDEIAKFAKAERLAYFDTVTGENLKLYKEADVEVVYFVGTEEQYKAVVEETTLAAMKSRGHYAFAFLDAGANARMATQVAGTSEGPAFRIAAPEGQKGTFKGPESVDVKVDELIKFCLDHKEGKLKIELRSEPVIEANPTSDVVELVGSNIRSVLGVTDEFLLIVHAPWCGHCKKVSPVLDELATTLKNVGSKVVIAKIDGTANDLDLEGVAVTGYPSIFFKGNDQPIAKYAGGKRDLPDFLKYIHKRGSQDFDLEAALTGEKKSASDEL